MKRYINKQGHFFDYDDTFVVTDTELILMTDEEIAELNKPTEVQLQEQANAEARAKLNNLDWKVIRELERLMLTGTDLNLEREELRESIV